MLGTRRPSLQPPSALLPFPRIGADGVEAASRAPIQRFLYALQVGGEGGNIAGATGGRQSADAPAAGTLERRDDFSDRLSASGADVQRDRPVRLGEPLERLHMCLRDVLDVNIVAYGRAVRCRPI